MPPPSSLVAELAAAAASPSAVPGSSPGHSEREDLPQSRSSLCAPQSASRICRSPLAFVCRSQHRFPIELARHASGGEEVGPLFPAKTKHAVAPSTGGGQAERAVATGWRVDGRGSGVACHRHHRSSAPPPLPPHRIETVPSLCQALVPRLGHQERWRWPDADAPVASCGAPLLLPPRHPVHIVLPTVSGVRECQGWRETLHLPRTINFAGGANGRVRRRRQGREGRREVKAEWGPLVGSARRADGVQVLQLPHRSGTGLHRLLTTITSLDSGKTIAKSSKAAAINGACQWHDSVLQAIQFPKDEVSQEFQECQCKIVVSMGSTRTAILGEAFLNLTNYLSSSDSTDIFLPLKKCNSSTILQTLPRERLMEAIWDLQGEEDLE